MRVSSSRASSPLIFLVHMAAQAPRGPTAKNRVDFRLKDGVPKSSDSRFRGPGRICTQRRARHTWPALKDVCPLLNISVFSPLLWGHGDYPQLSHLSPHTFRALEGTAGWLLPTLHPQHLTRGLGPCCAQLGLTSKENITCRF